MKKNDALRGQRAARRRWIAAAGLWLAAAGLVFWARRDPSGVARVFVPWARRAQGALSHAAVAPFPLTECLAYALAAAAPAALVVTAVRSVRGRSGRPALRFLSHAALWAGALACLFLSLWGLGAFAPPLANRLALDTAPASAQTLYDTAVWLRDEMNALAGQVPRGADGACAGGFDALAGQAGDGFRHLAARVPGAFEGAPAAPKRVIGAGLLSRLGLSGVYSPFLGEAMVNPDTIPAHLPFTMCHEMAHGMGYVSEDEANYIAFLACTANPDPLFAYSGYHLAFIYCANALGAADAALSARLWEDVSPLAHADFDAQRAYLKRHEGPARAVGEAVNDAYLRTMNQPEGTRSYGRVVDLLIADYRARTM
ncbi:MAG: DUF3810 domain-containing protein [Oscillospiraceae bacterium]|jgi:hypothetical protein|nr:DUF3810 domain-containing protein [Oscillospiraceae bacterium]